MTPEERKRIVADGIRQLKKIKPPDEPSDVDRLIERGKLISAEVAKIVNEVDAAVRDSGRTHDRAALAQVVSQLYLDRFCHWNREELLQLLVIIHTENAVAELI